MACLEVFASTWPELQKTYREDPETMRPETCPGRYERGDCLEDSAIHLPDGGGGLESSICFGVDCLIEQPTPVAELSTALFHLGYDRWLGPFAKKSDEDKLFLGSVSIKLYEDRLKMFELRRPVLYFLLLALKVALNPTPDGIHNRPGVSLTNPKIKPMGNIYSYMQKNT